jgi:hypothetical protein
VPVRALTVAVIVELLTPLAGTVEGAAVTVTLLGTTVWVIWVIALLPD